MLRSITTAALFAAAALVSTVSQQAQAGCHSYVTPRVTSTKVVTQVTQEVTQVNHLKISRTQLPSGATITMFANFLGNDPGFVILNVDDVSLSCKVVDWQSNRVTLELPELGIKGPKAADLNLVRPDGRVVQQFSIDLVPPQRIVVHETTIQTGIQISVPQAPRMENSNLLLTK